MTNPAALLKQVKKQNHQGLPIANLFIVLKEYWPLGQHMLRTFGWRSWMSFWITKLFVADEGGEYAILNPAFKKFPQLLRKPFKLEMEHTTICNKQCLFCEHTYWGERSEKTTFDQLKQIVDPIKSLQWINITGEGSSFLNKDFIPMLEYLRGRHINVNFVDEFDFLDERMARKIITLGINSIYISFDAATRKTYERIKKGCNYEKALDNIRLLLGMKERMKSPFPVLHFRFIITRLNYREMPDYINLISSLKNRGVRARVELVGLLSFPGIEQYYMPLDDIPEDILCQTLENAIEHNINLHLSHAGTTLPSMGSCGAWTEPYILIGGEVISCCAIIMSNNRAFLRDNTFGNAYKTPFLDIWKSHKYRGFRRLVNRTDGKVPKTCYGCRAYDTAERAEKFGIES